MEAHEFVKKFGWGCACDLWKGAFPLYENNMCILNGCVCTLNSDFLFNLLDLKSLIESHDFVEKLGGLDEAKDEYFNCVQNNEPASHISKAIEDVERCL